MFRKSTRSRNELFGKTRQQRVAVESQESRKDQNMLSQMIVKAIVTIVTEVIIDATLNSGNRKN